MRERLFAGLFRRSESGDDIHHRITSAMVLYTIAVMVIIGGISILSIHHLVKSNIRLSVQSDAAQMAQKLEETLHALQHDLENLSANSLVMNTIIDTQGSKVYIDPFIKSYHPNGNVDTRITICDFTGNPIATNAPRPVAYNDPGILRQTIDRGTAYAVLWHGEAGDNTQRILLAYPVVWSMTKKPEGILVAEIVVADLVNDVLPVITESRDEGLVVRSDNRVLFSRNTQAKPSFTEMHKILSLEDPLKGLNLSVKIDDYRELRLWWMVPMYTFAVVALLLLCVLPAQWISSALTVHLRALSGLARQVAESGSLELKAEVSGPDEVQALAVSFNEMIEKVKTSQENLEARVRERTADLTRSNSELALSNEEKERLIRELQEALANIKTLRGLVPICSSCKKIRDDKGYWNQIEMYLAEHAEIDFSHGICPDCAEKYYKEFLKKDD